ncbi:hypothetical protein K402DRAFT_416776 [Aulographum hederae CBS 113979]|uniref:Uncharacterized protein n=1 Tax=Aulographum hederae CBS 113979 TaxID=1176131 RepID=A0A6G1HE66_9PEZI|nr:hypothetical protein K402DRAFT_416776 [Aulographum hederae CBS 113979]
MALTVNATHAPILKLSTELIEDIASRLDGDPYTRDFNDSLDLVNFHVVNGKIRHDTDRLFGITFFSSRRVFTFNKALLEQFKANINEYPRFTPYLRTLMVMETHLFYDERDEEIEDPEMHQMVSEARFIRETEFDCKILLYALKSYTNCEMVEIDAWTIPPKTWDSHLRDLSYKAWSQAATSWKAESPQEAFILHLGSRLNNIQPIASTLGNLSTGLSGLRSLSLERITEYSDSTLTFLSLVPSLEELHLEFFDLLSSYDPPPWPIMNRVSQHLNEAARLPNLKRLKLKGFKLDRPALKWLGCHGSHLQHCEFVGMKYVGRMWKDLLRTLMSSFPNGFEFVESPYYEGHHGNAVVRAAPPQLLDGPPAYHAFYPYDNDDSHDDATPFARKYEYEAGQLGWMSPSEHDFERTWWYFPQQDLVDRWIDKLNVTWTTTVSHTASPTEDTLLQFKVFLHPSEWSNSLKKLSFYPSNPDDQGVDLEELPTLEAPFSDLSMGPIGLQSLSLSIHITTTWVPEFLALAPPLKELRMLFHYDSGPSQMSNFVNEKAGLTKLKELELSRFTLDLPSLEWLRRHGPHLRVCHLQEIELEDGVERRLGPTLQSAFPNGWLLDIVHQEYLDAYIHDASQQVLEAQPSLDDYLEWNYRVANGNGNAMGGNNFTFTRTSYMFPAEEKEDLVDEEERERRLVVTVMPFP